MKKTIIIFAIGIILFSSCKQTELDIEWENTLIGHKWEPRDKNNTKISYMPILEFAKDNRGKSYLRINSTEIDEFGWEIRRKEMRLFYDKAPSEYSIGQDSYNSKALFRVVSVESDVFEVKHLTSTGFEVDYRFFKLD